MRPLQPALVLLVHGVAVRATGGVVTEVLGGPGVEDGEDPDTQDRAEQSSQGHTCPAREGTSEVLPSRKDETLHECLFFECPRCRFHRTTWWDRVV